MSKSKRSWILFSFVLLLGLYLPTNVGAQTTGQKTGQEQEKKKIPPVQQTVSGTMGGVVGGVVGTPQGQGPGQSQGQAQGGVIGGITKVALDDDFLLAPRTIVTFKVEHLLVKPAETVALLDVTSLRTESGMSVSYSIRWPEPAKAIVGLEITPTIIDGKGLNLKISVLKDGQVIKEEKVLASNLEPVIVELFKNEADHIKLAEKITPFIQTVEPLQNYPKALDRLEIAGDVLIMNDIMVVNHARGGMLACDGGSEASPFFFYFWIKGKGIYVLSLWPFPGAKPLGVISDSVIRIRHDRDYFAWYSLRPILPEGKWRVWVRNNPDYDPLQVMSRSIPEKDRQRVQSVLGKENAAVTGVGGKGSPDRFFKGIRD
jgi:hypothetical protein